MTQHRNSIQFQIVNKNNRTSKNLHRKVLKKLKLECVWKLRLAKNNFAKENGLKVDTKKSKRRTSTRLNMFIQQTNSLILESTKSTLAHFLGFEFLVRKVENILLSHEKWEKFEDSLNSLYLPNFKFYCILIWQFLSFSEFKKFSSK